MGSCIHVNWTLHCDCYQAQCCGESGVMLFRHCGSRWGSSLMSGSNQMISGIIRSPLQKTKTQMWPSLSQLMEVTHVAPPNWPSNWIWFKFMRNVKARFFNVKLISFVFLFAYFFSYSKLLQHKTSRRKFGFLYLHLHFWNYLLNTELAKRKKTRLNLLK